MNRLGGCLCLPANLRPLKRKYFIFDGFLPPAEYCSLSTEYLWRIFYIKLPYRSGRQRTWRLQIEQMLDGLPTDPLRNELNTQRPWHFE